MQFTAKARDASGSIRITIPVTIVESFGIKETNLITLEIVKVRRK